MRRHWGTLDPCVRIPKILKFNYRGWADATAEAYNVRAGTGRAGGSPNKIIGGATSTSCSPIFSVTYS